MLSNPRRESAPRRFIPPWSRRGALRSWPAPHASGRCGAARQPRQSREVLSREGSAPRGRPHAPRGAPRRTPVRVAPTRCPTGRNPCGPPALGGRTGRPDPRRNGVPPRPACHAHLARPVGGHGRAPMPRRPRRRGIAVPGAVACAHPTPHPEARPVSVRRPGVRDHCRGVMEVSEGVVPSGPRWTPGKVWRGLRAGSPISGRRSVEPGPYRGRTPPPTGEVDRPVRARAIAPSPGAARRGVPGAHAPIADRPMARPDQICRRSAT